MEAIKHSLGNLLKELEQIRATLTVHIDVCYETLGIFRSFMNLPWPLVTQYQNSAMTQLSYVRSSCGRMVLVLTHDASMSSRNILECVCQLVMAIMSHGKPSIQTSSSTAGSIPVFFEFARVIMNR